MPVCTAPTRGSGQTADGEDAIIAQYDMIALEKVGMLKMDMLGLKTLTVIHDAVNDRRGGGAAPDLEALGEFGGPPSTRSFAGAGPAGVFQFESPLATETLRNAQV